MSLLIFPKYQCVIAYNYRWYTQQPHYLIPRVITWKLSEKTYSTFDYKKSPIYADYMFDVHIELVVKLAGTEVQVRNFVSGELVASTKINAPVIKLYIRKNMVAAKIGQTIVSRSRFLVWEICGNELVLRCTVKSPSEFSNCEIILGESFGPTLAPFALYLISSKEEKELGQVSYLQEVDFGCRKPKIITFGVTTSDFGDLYR